MDYASSNLGPAASCQGPVVNGTGPGLSSLCTKNVNGNNTKCGFNKKNGMIF